MTKSVADVVLLKDQFSRPAGSDRRGSPDRPQHSPSRPPLPDQDRHAAALIILVSVPGFTFPSPAAASHPGRLPDDRHPPFVLALAPSDGPLYHGRLLRALGAFAIPAGP